MYDSYEAYKTLVKYGTPIWEDLFMVEIPYKNTRSILELKEFGLPSTGNSYLDREAHNELITVYLTVDALVEHYRVGTTMRFPRNEDTYAIYDMVMKYTRQWAYILSHGVNTSTVPIEDLLLLDKFAEKLLVQAKMFCGDRIDTTQSLTAMFGNMFGQFSSLRAAAKPQEVAPVPDEKHESYASIFAKRIVTEKPKTGMIHAVEVNQWK